MSNPKTYQNLLTAVKAFGICPGQEVWFPADRVIYHSHQTTVRGAAPAKYRVMWLNLSYKEGKVSCEALVRTPKNEEFKLTITDPKSRLTYSRQEVQKVCDESNKKAAEAKPASKPAAKKPAKKAPAKKAAPKAKPCKCCKPCKKAVAKKPAKKSSK